MAASDICVINSRCSSLNGPTVGPFSDEHRELMAQMSLAAMRPLNWNVLGVGPNSYHEHQLSASDYAAERGATVVALTPSQVMTLRLNLVSGFIFDAFPEWAPVIGLPIEERRAALGDPSVRERLAKGADSDAAGPLRAIARWEEMRVIETFAAENEGLVGRMIGEIAQDRGATPFDAMLDVAIADDLRTSFQPVFPAEDDAVWRKRAEIWLDPRTVIGASDAGAHLDMIDTFTCSTSLLGPGVREKGLMALEEAVHQLTQVPASLYGIEGRGLLAEGCHADVVVFDADRVGPGPVHFRPDLPAGASRLYAEADGIDCVIANGTEIVRDGAFAGARPGTVLRPGRDTKTVPVPGGER